MKRKRRMEVRELVREAADRLDRGSRFIGLTRARELSMRTKLFKLADYRVLESIASVLESLYATKRIAPMEEILMMIRETMAKRSIPILSDSQLEKLIHEMIKEDFDNMGFEVWGRDGELIGHRHED